MKIKRYDGESEISFIVRCCQSKTTESWDEIGEYINSVLEKFNWVSGIKNIFKKKDETLEVNNNIINIDNNQIDENKDNFEEK